MTRLEKMSETLFDVLVDGSEKSSQHLMTLAATFFDGRRCKVKHPVAKALLEAIMEAKHFHEDMEEEDELPHSRKFEAELQKADDRATDGD